MGFPISSRTDSHAARSIHRLLSGAPAVAGRFEMTRNRRRRASLAGRADRYQLYQNTVQDAPSDAAFLDDEFHRRTGRRALSFREDFCGAAALACEFVARRPEIRAIGVDLDPEALAWGRHHNLARLNRGERERIRLVQSDVLDLEEPPVDLIAAMNFSYWIFETRDRLRGYFERVRKALNPGGLFFADAYGGSDCHEEKEYAREEDGVDFIWDQVAFDPMSNRMRCAIHYEFPDGSRLENAFRYQWRFWSLPELLELLAEAGFSKTVVLWEGADENGDGNGVFEEVTEGSADETWIAYLVSAP